MNDTKGAPEEQRSPEEQPATEEQTQKIDAIVGNEVLGYEGEAHGEHSGQDSTPHEETVPDPLADNRPEQM